MDLHRKSKDWFSKTDGPYTEGLFQGRLEGALVIKFDHIFKSFLLGGFQRDMLDDPVQESLETVVDSKSS